MEGCQSKKEQKRDAPTKKDLFLFKEKIKGRCFILKFLPSIICWWLPFRDCCLVATRSWDCFLALSIYVLCTMHNVWVLSGHFGFLPQSKKTKTMSVWLSGVSKLPMGFNVCMHGSTSPPFDGQVTRNHPWWPWRISSRRWMDGQTGYLFIFHLGFMDVKKNHTIITCTAQRQCHTEVQRLRSPRLESTHSSHSPAKGGSWKFVADTHHSLVSLSEEDRCSVQSPRHTGGVHTHMLKKE